MTVVSYPVVIVQKFDVILRQSEVEGGILTGQNLKPVVDDTVARLFSP